MSVRIYEGTPQPFLDACRVLLARGMTGPVELWDTVRPYPRMRSTIEEAAKWTVEENEKTAPRFRKWRPYVRKAPPAADHAPRGTEIAPEEMEP